MILVRVLQRKDAASVVVAIVIAMVVSQALSIMTSQPAAKLVGLGDQYGAGPGWKVIYLQPLVSLVLQVVALELLIRLVVWARGMFVTKRPR